MKIVLGFEFLGYLMVAFCVVTLVGWFVLNSL